MNGYADKHHKTLCGYRIIIHKKYLWLFLLLFSIELIIGLFVHDGIVRPFMGDLLVVILLYCLLKSLIDIPFKPAATCVLIFAYLVEISQYFHIVNLLGLSKYRLARIIIGTTFSWTDMLCYTIGMGMVIVMEKVISRTNSR